MPEKEFVITRVFDGPREPLFKMWIEPKHIAQWWGPRTFDIPVCETDVRQGGAYRIVMRGTDRVDYPVKGVYREIVRPERLVMTMDCSEHPEAWHDLVKPNRPKEERNPAGELLQTTTFEEVGGRTKLTIRIHFESPAIRDAMLKMGMTEGWSQSLDRLAEQVAKIERKSATKSDGKLNEDEIEETPKKKPFTRHFPTIARILMGLPLFVFGLNGFFNFIPQPTTPLPEGATAFAGALMNTRYMLPLIGVTCLIVGTLLLLNRFVPLALAFFAPFIVNSIAFHVFLEP